MMKIANDSNLHDMLDSSDSKNVIQNFLPQQLLKQKRVSCTILEISHP